MEPEVLVVNKGDRVIIEVKNPRKHVHSFFLPAFGINTGPLEPRTGARTVEFVADKAGVFQWLCGTPFDPAKGICDPDHETMVGCLVVLG